jgi:hypothetical protein
MERFSIRSSGVANKLESHDGWPTWAVCKAGLTAVVVALRYQVRNGTAFVIKEEKANILIYAQERTLSPCKKTF